MNPILAIGYLFNLLLISGIFGFVGVVLTLGISALIYFSLSQNSGDNKKFIAQVVALSIGYIAGTAAVIYAPWAAPAFNVAALVLEPLVFFLFLALGRR